MTATRRDKNLKDMPAGTAEKCYTIRLHFGCNTVFSYLGSNPSAPIRRGCGGMVNTLNRQPKGSRLTTQGSKFQTNKGCTIQGCKDVTLLSVANVQEQVMFACFLWDFLGFLLGSRHYNTRFAQ